MSGWGERWEHGSEFHALFAGAGPGAHPWGTAGAHHGSGRDALRAVMADGRDHRGWRRLWVPSFFCQEVVASLLLEGLPVLPYDAGPEEAQPDLASVPLRSGDALLRVNLFGLQALGPVDLPRRDGVEVIEDHTHDPWSERAWSSDADWCVASLRKTVPVPDGGVLWSPLGRPLPPAPVLTPERRLASLEKFSAMLLKDAYLRGEAVAKDLFRALALEGEHGIGEGGPSAMAPWSRALMDTFPLEAWRRQRAANHRALSGALADLPGARVLKGAPGSCPFFGVLVFDRAQERDRVRRNLVQARIYPGAHWPMEPPAIEGIPAGHVDLSRRILTLHCDARYQPEDMARVASAVLAASV